MGQKNSENSNKSKKNTENMIKREYILHTCMFKKNMKNMLKYDKILILHVFLLNFTEFYFFY